jgi:hypothetical protein
MSTRDASRPALDEVRTARLICADALSAEELDPRAIGLAAPRLRGELAYIALKLGWRGYRSLAVEPALDLRRRQLADRAPGPPRVLIRVDEFPHAHARDEPRRFSSEAFGRFHDVLAGAGVPYLIAVLPRVAHDYLNVAGGDGEELAPDEMEMLARLREDGVAFGLHGHTHRTRDPRPRHRSVVHGMGAAELELALDAAEEPLRRCGIEPRVFVPPFNHFDFDQYAVLARRYAVICGGPETVRAMGLQMSPRWIGDALYLPSYEPLYGRSGTVADAVEALAGERAAIWAAVTLHFGWELEDDLRSLAAFARAVAPYAQSWEQFLGAVDASR